VIDRSLAASATALTEIAKGADAELIADLVPLLGRGLVIAQREMVLHLLDTEHDWPWNK